MKMEAFLKALRDGDFGIGDSFRLGNFEFEVVGTRGPNRVDDDGPVFRQAGFSGGHRDGVGADDALGELERAALYRLVSGGGATPGWRVWSSGDEDRVCRGEERERGLGGPGHGREDPIFKIVAALGRRVRWRWRRGAEAGAEEAGFA